MNLNIPLGLVDYGVILIFFPIFFFRLIHWAFDRHIFRNRKASEDVDSFMKEFSQYIASLEVRPGRSVSVLHIPRSNRDTEKGIIIFVHGSCARMQQFVNQIRYFMKDGYEIVSYDALGCGNSTKPIGQSYYVSDEMYQDFVAIVERFTLHKKSRAVCIVGHSFGGAMVTKLAVSAESTALTQTAVSLCQPVNVGLPRNPGSIFRLPISVLWLIRPLLGLKARELLLGPHAKDDLRQLEKEASARNPVHMFKSFYSGIDPGFFNVDLFGEKPFVPLLLIAGDSDKICPPDGIRALDKRLKCANLRSEIATECGHQCMQEDPDQINRSISSFVAEMGRKA
jgi:pimeloyl-ACP methyl ester carboxylesterase